MHMSNKSLGLLATRPYRLSIGYSFEKFKLEMPRKIILILAAMALYGWLAVVNLPSKAKPSAGFTPAQLKWQEECVQKNVYTRVTRREVLRRFGISIEIHESMDYLIESNDPEQSVTIADIEAIATLRCNRMAMTLHNLDLPGGGIPSIAIRSGERFPQTGQDNFLDAIIVAGRKIPIYTDYVEIWASFKNPQTGATATIEGYDIGLEFFKKFASKIQLSQ